MPTKSSRSREIYRMPPKAPGWRRGIMTVSNESPFSYGVRRYSIYRTFKILPHGIINQFMDTEAADFPVFMHPFEWSVFLVQTGIKTKGCFDLVTAEDFYQSDIWNKAVIPSLNDFQRCNPSLSELLLIHNHPCIRFPGSRQGKSSLAQRMIRVEIFFPIKSETPVRFLNKIPLRSVSGTKSCTAMMI